MARRENQLDRIPPVNELTLHCRVGESLVAKLAAQTEEGEQIHVGAVYEVVGRKGYGWDLKLLYGTGAADVRLLNSRILEYFESADRGVR